MTITKADPDSEYWAALVHKEHERRVAAEQELAELRQERSELRCALHELAFMLRAGGNDVYKDIDAILKRKPGAQ